MNLLCKIGRHRWVTRQEVGETGHPEAYQQCDRCGHYPKTSRWTEGGGGGGGGGGDRPLDLQGGAG